MALPGRVPCSCLAATGMWETLKGAGIWDQSPLGSAGHPDPSFGFVSAVLGLFPFSQGSVFPLPQARVAACPEPQDWHCHPLYQREQAVLALGLSQQILPWLTGLQGPPQPPYLPQPCSAGDKPSSLARGIICDPLVFNELALKNVIFGAGPMVPGCIRSGLIPCFPAVCWGGAGASLVQWGQ